MNQIAKEAAQKIIWDLTCRKGLKHEWDCIDKEIQEEIEEAWTKIIVEQFSNRLEQQVIPKIAGITRLVLVDRQPDQYNEFGMGRIYDDRDVKLEALLQDDDRTLKIFIHER